MNNTIVSTLSGEPPRWFLSRAEHSGFFDDTTGCFLELPFLDGPWLVIFTRCDQKAIVMARGFTFQDAWDRAQRKCAAVEKELMNREVFAGVAEAHSKKKVLQ